MEYLFFGAVLVFYLYRTFTAANKKAKAEAEQRRNMNPNRPPDAAPPAPKSLEEVLAEVFRETEMKTKPYGEKKQVIKDPQKQRKVPRQREVPRTATTYTTVKKAETRKKTAEPFLTADYTPEAFEPEGTRSQSMDDFIKQTQVSEANAIKKKPGILSTFSLRKAVIAKIVLDRPEW